jgi:hypothetical protein
MEQAMTLLARIEADLALCEKAPHWTCPDDWADCNEARTGWPLALRALKVAVEGIAPLSRCEWYKPSDTCACDGCRLRALSDAIERELTGGS